MTHGHLGLMGVSFFEGTLGFNSVEPTRRTHAQMGGLSFVDPSNWCLAFGFHF